MELRLAKEPRPMRPDMAQFMKRQERRSSQKEIDWLVGDVRDAEGRAMVGASVDVLTEYDSGMRLSEDARQATTDATGHFRVRGPDHGFFSGLTVIVHTKDRPPAFALYPPPDEDKKAPPPLTVTLGDKASAGSATITVVKDGKPLPGAGVRLVQLGTASRFGSYFHVGGWHDRGHAETLYNPTAVTGPDGVARFNGLFPGMYQVLAAEENNPRALSSRRWARHTERTAFGEVVGLAIVAGREARVSLAMRLQPCMARLRFLRPDGTPVRNQSITLGFGLGEARVETFLELDDNGVGTFTFEAPGLWTIEGKFLDAPTNSSVNREPYYQADATLPISPGLDQGEPITLRAVLHDGRKRGAIRARLIGPDGLPARGVVAHDNHKGQLDQAGSADERGEVRFADLNAEHYMLRGFLEGFASPAVVEPTGPLPDEAELRAARVVRPETVEVKPGIESSVEMRTEPVGYLRGTIQPPAGLAASDYSVYANTGRNDLPTRWRFDEKTGRYSFGPLPVGPLVLHFQQAKGDLLLEAGTQDVEIIAGAAAEVDLKPHVAKPPGEDDGNHWHSREVFPEAGSSVLMADGKTPAFAAEAVLFGPDDAQAFGEGVTDASGRLTFGGRVRYYGSDDPVRVGLVTKPTAVVRLPGEAGAAILAYEPGQTIRAVLPRPIAATGLVTLGGRSIGERNAQVRIVAAYQGRGVLDDVLSVEASAQNDGRFVLPGLTPGHYLIQATRDGIWLSSTVELVAEESKAPPTIVLDIPEPGAPIAIEVVDPDGRPLANEAVRPVRPEGPLRSLWPAELRTDADGLVTLRGLEAGRHEILIGAQHQRHEVQVPEASGAAIRPIATRVTLKPK